MLCQTRSQKIDVSLNTIDQLSSWSSHNDAHRKSDRNEKAMWLPRYCYAKDGVHRNLENIELKTYSVIMIGFDKSI